MLLNVKYKISLTLFAKFRNLSWWHWRGIMKAQWKICCAIGNRLQICKQTSNDCVGMIWSLLAQIWWAQLWCNIDLMQHRGKKEDVQPQNDETYINLWFIITRLFLHDCHFLLLLTQTCLVHMWYSPLLDFSHKCFLYAFKSGMHCTCRSHVSYCPLVFATADYTNSHYH